MAEWQRPAACSTEACIEVRVWPKAVEIRNSADGDTFMRVFASPDEWAAFVAAVKAGEYDAPET